MKKPQKKLKILFIIDNYHPFIGGAEILAQKVAEGLIKKNHDVTVITSNVKNADKFETLNGVKIYRITSNRYTLPLKAFFKSFKESKDCHIIHTSTYSMLPLAWFFSKFRRKNSSIVVHELLGKIWYMNMTKLSAFIHFNAERFMIRFFKFNRYIAVSAFTLNQLKDKNIPENKCSLIYNGIDALPVKPKSEFENLELFLNSSHKLIFAGRPGPSKGVMTLLESIKGLKETNPDVHLLMLLGEEPRDGYQKVLTFIKKYNLEKMITIQKQVPYQDLKAYLQLADAFVLPSFQEGFGILGGQLSTLDKPIIAAKNGALPEVLSGKVIWIPSIEPEHITKGIIDSIEGNFTTIPPKNFDWNSTIDKYEQIFMEMCNES